MICTSISCRVGRLAPGIIRLISGREIIDVKDADLGPASLIEQCAAQITAYGRHETLMTGEDERQLSTWAVERAMRKARSEAKGPPCGLPLTRPES
jgi:hypothetical protein